MLKQKYSIARMLQMAETKKHAFWKDAGEQRAYEVFKAVAAKVPAYRDFLKKNGVNPAAIKNYADFKKLPAPDKNSYFRSYPLEKILWPKTLDQEYAAICATSGSTGEPTYLPRTLELDWEFSFWLEYFMNQAKPGRTLFIIGFSLGMWQAGMLTYSALYQLGLRGRDLSIISTGINKKEIINALRNVAPDFDHVVIFAYPPFMKDVIDEAVAAGINFKKMHLRLVFGGETYTETFRDQLARKAHIKDIYRDTYDVYGCAEGGGVAWETPGCIFIRRLALKHPAVYGRLFNQAKNVPTLAQFNPLFCWFEEHAAELFLTVDNAVPLVRYRLKDSGGTLDLARIEKVFAEAGINLRKEARTAGVKLLDLPFVYAYERNDFTVSFYGLQIYPQHLKRALEKKSLEKYLTGKFAMAITYDKEGNQQFEINLEMRPGVAQSAALVELAAKEIAGTLLDLNTEYRELTRMLSLERTKPRLNFWEYNHDKYFKAGTKQKWLVKA